MYIMISFDGPGLAVGPPPRVPGSVGWPGRSPCPCRGLAPGAPGSSPAAGLHEPSGIDVHAMHI